MRVLFVDILRLLALLQMVNGHTLDALLSSGSRHGPIYDRYLYVRGLVSVAFLVVAGISFHLTTVVKLAQHRQDGAAIRKRVRRAVEVIAVGYLLQVSRPSAYLDPQRAEAAFRSLFRFEVLQCVGVSLLVLECLTLVVRNRRQLIAACAALAAATFAMAPVAELASAHSRPSLLAGLLGHAHGSQFPLFPWAGYVFAGVVLGALALPSAGATSLARRVATLAAGGVTLLFASSALANLSVPIFGVRTSSLPWFTVHKLAAIALLLALLALASARLRTLPRQLQALGSETLAIFVFHLHVIYGSSYALAPRFGRSLPLDHALLASLFNIAVSAAFGLGYHALKPRLFAGLARVHRGAARLVFAQRERRAESQSDWWRRSAS